MEIKREDLEDLVQLIKRKLEAGYRWFVYQVEKDVLKLEDVSICKTFAEAESIAGGHPVRLDLIYMSGMRELENSDQKTNMELALDLLAVLDEGFAFQLRRAEDIAGRLMQWGIPHDLTSLIEQLGQNDAKHQIQLQTHVDIGKNKFSSTIFIQPGASGFYEFEKFNCSLIKHIEIPDLFIHGINCRKLDKEMSLAFGHREELIVSLFNKEEKQRIIDAVISFGMKLDELSASAQGRDVAEKLMAKHWLGTGMEGLIPDPHKLEKKYVIKQNFDTMGEETFTHREAYNLMCDRYVSKPVIENGVRIEPWYYRHNGPGASFSNLVRVDNSEHLNIHAHVEKLVRDGFVIECSANNFAGLLRRGDEVIIDQVQDGYKQKHTGYFNPFLNDMELTAVGPKMKVDQSKDLGNDLGKGRQI